MLVSDIETTGFLKQLTTPAGRFHCAVTIDYFTGEKKRYRPDDVLAYIRDLEAEAAKPDGLIVFHNGINYDHPALDILKRKLTGKRLNIPRKKILDTLVMSRLVFSNIKDSDMALLRAGKLPGKAAGSHALKAWGFRLGLLKGDYGEQEDAWAAFNEEMLEYCDLDVQVTVKLLDKLLTAKHYFPDGNIFELAESVRLEHEAAWPLAQMQRNGFPFDEKGAERLYATLAGERSDILMQLVETFGSWYKPRAGNAPFRHPRTGEPLTKYPRVIYPKQGDIFLKPKTKKERANPKLDKRPYVEGAPYTPVEHVVFNPSSRDHIIKVLKDAGWVPVEFTPAGAPKVDDDVLEFVRVDDPEKQACIELVRKYLMIQKRIGQIAEGDKAWLRYYDKDTGCIHGAINPNGAVTGRATHMHPNIAQVPSGTAPYGPECRALFGAGLKGWVQIGTDASGLELRCLGHFGAPFDGGAYAETVVNGDIHWLNAQAAGFIAIGTVRIKEGEGHEAHDEARSRAKTFIYAFLYGAGDALIGQQLGGDAAKGKATKAAFLENTPVISELRDSIQKTLVADQKWNNATRKFDVKWKRRWIKGLDGRQVHIRSTHSALNALLQSAGALICKAWVAETETLLIEKYGLVHGWDGDFAYLAWVHDEMQIACRTQEIAELVAKVSQEAMENVAARFKFRVPLATESKIGANWAQCH